uniref:Reverse transcriptase domain-containing protein n=1 Tax=Oryzias latipes TaxID=8090 RepID=A0A3B3HP02_ORYLA
MNAQTALQFSAAFSASELCSLDVQDGDVDKLLGDFSSVCTGILDVIAPYKVKRSKPAPEPWINDHTRALRRSCRRAERKWKKDGLHVSLQIFRNSLTEYQAAVKNSKTQFMSNVVSENISKPKVLFNSLKSLLSPGNLSCLTPSVLLCEQFLTFFIDKVSAVRFLPSPCTPDPSVLTPPPAIFDQFEPVTVSQISEIVQHLRPSSCPGDCIPPRLLKEVFDTIGPWIVGLLNSSLVSGCVPAAFKHAVVHPLLKKHNLDPNVLSNFRPISKLSFLSKILEKVVYLQLQEHLTNYDIFEKFQSGFKSCHSTETALLRVCNDLLLAADSGASTVLILLDLSAAFDTVDHSVLLSRLEQSVGVKGTALSWFSSYLCGRSFSVQLGQCSSSEAPLKYGVPQGSVLGPLLFSLYLLPLGSIFRKYNVSFHCYADDIQIYLPLKSGGADVLDRLQNCLADIKSWMELNFLCLNENKTEVFVFGKTDLLTGCCSAVGPLDPSDAPFIRDLGVNLDRHFKFDRQVSVVVQSSFYHLRLISKVKPYLPPHALQQVIHALIFSRLDYCNSLYSGIDQSLLRRLQLVQNSAAR